MKEINQIIEEIQQVNNILLNERELYNKNRREEKYNPNFQYDDYDDEIIEGESVMDCLLENLTRNKNILKLGEDICCSLMINISFLKICVIL